MDAAPHPALRATFSRREKEPPPVRVITIIDGLSIEIIDGISSIRRVLRVPVASFSCRFSLLQTAAAL